MTDTAPRTPRARRSGAGGRVVTFPKAGAAPARRPKVVVTGGAGFFGARLVRSLLLRGEHEVVVFDLVPPAEMPVDVRHRFLDLNLPFADGTLYKLLLEEKPDVIVHLAQLRSPSHQATYAHELNSIGALHVFAAAGEAKVPRVILGSTSLVYGARGDNPNFLTEEHPLRPDPQDRFVKDFVEAETHAREHVRRHPETGRADPPLRAAPLARGPRLPDEAVRVARLVDAHGLRPARPGAPPRRRGPGSPSRARPPRGPRRLQRRPRGDPPALDRASLLRLARHPGAARRSRTRSTRPPGSPASASCRASTRTISAISASSRTTRRGTSSASRRGARRWTASSRPPAPGSGTADSSTSTSSPTPPGPPTSPTSAACIPGESHRPQVRAAS